MKNEFWTEFIQLVFKQCTIAGAYGNNGNRERLSAAELLKMNEC